jgi:glycosyltransferase involved in cell wall biosynthesis
MSNDEAELRKYCEQLLADPQLAVKMGEAARETIKEKFSQNRFVDEWNKIFDKAYEVIK